MKKERIEIIRGYIKANERALERAKMLHGPLKEWTKKKVNKTFFAKYFKEYDENGNERKDWRGNYATSFYFSAPLYDWSDYTKRIYLAGEHSIELKGTETKTVLESVESTIASLIATIESYQHELKTLESFDEDGCIRDLIAIYEKYGKPEQWHDVLGMYKVRYPNG